MEAGVIGTDSTKAMSKEKEIRQKIIQSANVWGIRPIDITTNLLIEKGAYNVDEVMQVVRKLICEYYGIGMWELMNNDKQFLMDKYGIPEDKFNVLCEGNIMLAYQEFAKHNNGDNTGQHNKSTPDEPLPKTTNIVDLPEAMVKKEEGNMLVMAKQNLQKMMEGETDKEKLELYEAQMKVLDLKLKNAGA